MPTANFKEFLMGEVRYSSLQEKFPEQADALLAKTEQDAMDKLAVYKRLASYKGNNVEEAASAKV